MSKRAAAALGVALLAAAPTARAGISEAGWRPDVPAAADYAARRHGIIRFAVIDENGRLYGHAASGTSPAASVFKVMLMATYLRQPSVRHRDPKEHTTGTCSLR